MVNAHIANNTCEPEAPLWVVELPVYSGPLDLLLDLIQRHQIDIFDIPIAFICDQFLSYLERGSQMNLKLGGEWIDMASTLLYIKSRRLLPKPSTDPDADDDVDPRELLVQRLLDYQMFRDAASALDNRILLGRDVFSSPALLRMGSDVDVPTVLPISSVPLDSLLSAFVRLIKRHSANESWTYDLSTQKLSLRNVIMEVAQLIQQHRRLRFEDLFLLPPSRNRIVTTFLALLEMVKIHLITVFEAHLDPSQPEGTPVLWIEAAVPDLKADTLELSFSSWDLSS